MDSESLSFNAGGYSHFWLAIKNILSYIYQRGKFYIIIIIISHIPFFVHS